MRFIEFLIEQMDTADAEETKMQVVDPAQTKQQQARQQQRVEAGDKTAIRRQIALVRKQMMKDPNSRRALQDRLNQLNQQMREPDIGMQI